MKTEGIDKGAVLKALIRARRTDLKKLKVDIGSRSGEEAERLQSDIGTIVECLQNLGRLARRVIRKSIRPGSLVALKSNEGRLEIILLIDKKVCQKCCSELPITCVAINAPLPKLLLGKKKGERVFFSGSTYKIVKVQ